MRRAAGDLRLHYSHPFTRFATLAKGYAKRCAAETDKCNHELNEAAKVAKEIKRVMERKPDLRVVE